MPVLLPICEKPRMSELHTTAFPLSVLEAANVSEPWLLENFLELAFLSVYGNVLTYDKPYFWFWDCFTFHIRLHLPGSNVVSSAINWLNKGYYVFLCVNEKYVPRRFAYQVKNFDHELLIYGYEESSSSFYTIAYDDTLKYTPQLMRANDVKRAFYHCKFHYFKFYPFRIKEGYTFEASAAGLKRQVQQYLSPEKKNKGYRAYGEMLSFLSNVPSGEMLDIRNFKTMLEHAGLLQIFIKQGLASKLAERQIQENMDLAQLMFYLVLKHNKTKDRDLRNRLIQYIHVFGDRERRIMEEMARVLKHTT